ncbi:MAG: SCO family protein [Cyclobacteriaceae bacterium]
MKNFWETSLVLSMLLLASCTESTTTAGQQEKQSRTDHLPFYNDPFFTPRWLLPGSDSLHGFHKISPFTLVNQLGDTITEKTFEGKIYVADFFFTICPGICPKMTENMNLVQEAFKDDDEVLLLSHSVTPERDTVAVLRKYAGRKGVTAGKWHLATGDRDHIYSLGRQDYFAEEDLGISKSADDFLHTENFILVDGNRHIRGLYNGINKASVQQLIADIKTLKKE